jgi:hypothetical protein
MQSVHDELLRYHKKAPNLVEVVEKKESVKTNDIERVSMQYDIEDDTTNSNLHYIKLLEGYNSFSSKIGDGEQRNSFLDVAFKEQRFNYGGIRENHFVSSKVSSSRNNLHSIKDKYSRSPLNEAINVPDQEPSVLTNSNSFDPLIKNRLLRSHERVTNAINIFTQQGIGPEQEKSAIEGATKIYPYNPFPNFKGNQFLDNMPADDEDFTITVGTKQSIGMQEMRISDSNNKIPYRTVSNKKRMPETTFVSDTKNIPRYSQEFNRQQQIQTESQPKSRQIPHGRTHERKSVSAIAKRTPKKSLWELIKHIFSLIGPLLKQLLRRLTSINPYTRSQFRAEVNQQGVTTQNPITSYSVYHNHAMAPWQSLLPIVKDPISTRTESSISKSKKYDIDYEQVT